MKKQLIAALVILMLATSAQADDLKKSYNEEEKLTREEYVDEQGNLFVGENGFARHVLLYDGGYVREEYYDADLRLAQISAGYAVVERKYDDNGRLVWYRYLDADEDPVQVNGVCEAEQQFDENGNLVCEILYDGFWNRTLHADGWCEHHITYDGLNRKVSERWLDDVGNPALYKGSYSGIDREFDDAGNVTGETYYDAQGKIGANASGVVKLERGFDEAKRVVWYRYVDAEGLPMSVGGIIEKEQGYDANGNLCLEILFDGNGNRTLHADGWCEHHIGYNEAKQKISERWLGAEGQPVLFKGSYSGIDRAFDDAGNVVREVYYDAEGNVGANASGVTVVERRYDAVKRLIWFRYLDADGLPESVGGIVEKEQGYDEAGNLALEILYDGEGNRVMHADGWCEHRVFFNDIKQKVSERWLGVDGGPALFKQSYSGIDRAFDAQGNVVRETYYDQAGNVGANSAGIVTIERRFDDARRIVWYRYLDADGAPMAVKSVFECFQDYDEAGNIVRESLCDGNGNPALHADGWCEHQSVFNEAKQKVAERWFGTDGEPALYKDSYSGIDRQFDEAGRVVRETYYDAEGNVGPNASGVVTLIRAFDENGRQTRQSYLDAEGEPMAIKGIGAFEQGYDEAGNLNLEIYYDAEGNRTLTAAGWCEHRVTFDAAKQKISERWLGVEGEPVLFKDSYSGIDRAFDEAGNVIRETYYDQDGKVGANASGVIAIERRFDGNKRAVWYRYLDGEGAPMPVGGVVEMAVGYDERGNVDLERVLDGEGNLAAHPDGWIEHRVVYNDAKQKVSERWLDIDGEPFLYKNSYSGIDRVFDAAGNAVRETYYDASGDVGPNASGVITIERRYDERKRLVWYRYLDAADEPMAVKGVYELEQGYDEAGNVALEVSLDGHGNRRLHPDGWAEHRVIYNEAKQKTAEFWTGVDGAPALYKKNYSGIERVFNEAGDVVRETYHDLTGEVGPNASGVTVTERRYDENRRLLWYRYLGADGQPVCVNGIYEFEQEYDDAGNIVREVLYDGNGGRALHPDGWCEHVSAYTEAKQKCSERWLGIDAEPVLYKKSYSGIDREFDAYGNVARETYRDGSGDVGPNASGITTITREYDADGHLLRFEYLDAEGAPTQVNGIFQMAQEYDGAGNVARETVLDGEGNRALSPDGWCEHQIQYNEARQRVSERWLGTEGEPVLFKGAYSGVDRAFDAAGNIVRETYYDGNGEIGANASGVVTIERRFDEKKRVVWYRYLDEEELPMALKGIYELEQGYDEAGNVDLEVVFDGYGNRALHPDGWCEHHTVYNELKQKVSERWNDVSGAPVLCKAGYSGLDRLFDEAGNTIRETYYGADGQVGANTSGYCVLERRFDENKRVVWYRYLDAEGRPVAIKGAREVEQGYDAMGKLNLEIVLDGQGGRALHTDGWCERRAVFDESGRKISERYFDTQGNPALFKKNYSGVDWVYGENGKPIRETYYDASGEIGPNAAGVIIVETDYDEAGRIVELRYYDKTGAPMILESLGASIEQREYDEYGNVCRTSLLGGDRVPVMGAKGWSSAAYVFDEAKHRISESYYGADGALVLIEGGYARVTRAYDAFGNVASESYYDQTGMPADNARGVATVNRVFEATGKTAVYEEYRDGAGDLRIDATSGCAAVSRVLDENGRVVFERYFGTDGNGIVNGKKKYAAVERRYDAAGRVLMESYFAADGTPMMVSGKQTLVRAYDDAGNVILERQYDAEGRIVTTAQGYGAIRRVYDERKRVVEERYFDEKGAPARCKSGYAAVLMTYAEGTKPISKAFFDTDGSRMEIGGYHLVLYAYDEKGNILTESYFDRNGKRALCDKGYAIIRNTYDENYKLADTTYYDAGTRPIVIGKGYASIDTVRDERGNVLVEKYYDAEGRLKTQSNGYAIIVKTYNENNKVLSQEYRDAQNKLVKAKNTGYARIEYDYDEAGNKTEERYYNASGKLAKPDRKKPAKKTWTYDEEGRVLSERYWDASGKPLMISAGHTGFLNWYSEDNTVFEQTYLNENGKVMTGWTKMGYCKLRKTYDETGKLLLKEEYLDGKGKPTRTSSGYFYGRVCEYDDQGRIIREYTYGENGKPYGGSRNYAIIEYSYDATGKKTAAYYNARGVRVK